MGKMNGIIKKRILANVAINYQIGKLDALDIKELIGELQDMYEEVA